MSDGFDATAAKSEVYRPRPETIANYTVPDYSSLRQQAAADPIAFWDAQARELVDWYEPYEQTLDAGEKPFTSGSPAAKSTLCTTPWTGIVHQEPGARTSWP